MRTERSPGGGRASPPDPAVAVEYLRKLEDSLRSWYQAADTKAQVALTLNGVFLGFVTGSILTNRGDVARTVTDFGPETWGLLAAMAAGLAGAIGCAVACLAARGVGRARARRKLARHGVDKHRADTYAPEVTVFFTHLAELQPDRFAERMRTIDQPFVIQALASDHVEWSVFIGRKHRWVNRAFILTGVTLALFLGVGVSYLVRVTLGA